MKKVINNFSSKPLLIYDGCEPKRIDYNILNASIEIDLWNEIDLYDDFRKEKINEFGNDLNFEFEKILDENKPVVDIEGNSTTLELAVFNSENANYYVLYTLTETQPTRYKCYIIAEIEES